MSGVTKEELEKLIDLSLEVKKNSYSPYSNFRVGCALLTKSGKYVTGVNVENSSYGLAICAERTALVKAVSEGDREFKALAVSTDLVDIFASPCGACRQFISEFGDMEIYFVKPDRSYQKTDVDGILPFRFTPKHLEATKTEK
eukprot:TRINITY_DN2587_c0_g1_i1.p1 TRINITY_DN2587_c0_g1~~TRINITY_DN2587_c0_g1_i1.p1  ORF type:complete len:143 (-),score=53.44 TRINITY_DN2587_c0_g1_i1:76-504(-)